MATTIVTKNSTTAASVPSAGSLTQGELAVNVTDKRLFTKDSGGNVVEVGTNPTALAVAGNTTVGGTLGVTGAFAANGGATLGDASGDALTINSSAVSIPNGLNFDSNTFVIDATNNRVGVGTASPAGSFQVVGANDQIRSGDGTTTTFLGGSGATGYTGTLTNHPFTFFTNSTERMRIDSSGNAGIGTSSPSYRLDTRASAGVGIQFLETSSGSTNRIQLGAGSGLGYINADAGSGSIALAMQVAGSEAMRIDSSRNLLVGTTSPLTSSTHSFVNSGAFGVLTLKNSNIASNYWITGPNSSNNYVVITQSGVGVVLSNGSTSWASASDERLKTDLTPIENAITKVNQLRCVTGRYKTDEEDVSRSFLIAQDVQAVLPEAVDVSEDELGTLNLRYTEIIPLLVASIKEQQAIITDLKARLEVLESK